MDWIKKKAKKAINLAHEPTTARAEQTPAKPAVANATARATAMVGATTAPVRVDNCVPVVRVRALGQQQSNLPHIFRDGGGGGTIDGQHVIIFADGTYTRGLPPTEQNRIVGFVSNSVAVVGARGAASTTIARVTDVGSAERGPEQAVAFLAEEGESAQATAVWPNQNIATPPGSDGSYGVCFPEVIDRDRFRAQQPALLYNTAVVIRLEDGGRRPRTTRAVQRLFVRGEPMYGSFCAYADGRDGYLYLFGRVSETDRPRSNGLKLARVRGDKWADRTQYEFWDGRQFGRTMPALDDGGAANVLRYSVDAFGKHYGPATGDVWWSEPHGAFVLLFQNAAAALDDSLYLSHSPTLTGGWSTPTCVYKIPRMPDGFSYAFHAYPNMMDAAGRVVPISWTQDSKTQACTIHTGEMLFF